MPYRRRQWRLVMGLVVLWFLAAFGSGCCGRLKGLDGLNNMQLNIPGPSFDLGRIAIPGIKYEPSK